MSSTSHSEEELDDAGVEEDDVPDEVDAEGASEEELGAEAEALPPESLVDSDLPESDFPVSEDFASLPLFVAGDFAPDLA